MMRKLILCTLTVTVLLLFVSCSSYDAQKDEIDDTTDSPEPADTLEPAETVESEEPTEPAITEEPEESTEQTVSAELSTPLPDKEELEGASLLDALSCDVDADGKQDYIAVYENNDVCFFTVNEDSEQHVVFDVWEASGYKTVKFLKSSDQKNYLLFSYYDYGTCTSVWYFEGLEPINIFNNDGAFVDYQNDVMTVSRITDTVGTWHVEYKYLLDKEGAHLLDVPYAMRNVTYDTVTIKIDIEAHYFDGESYTVEGMIEAGAVIIFTHILMGDNEQYIYFELEDGTKGRFLVEKDEEELYGVTVNGKAIEECFVDIREYFNDTWP